MAFILEYPTLKATYLDGFKSRCNRFVQQSTRELTAVIPFLFDRDVSVRYELFRQDNEVY
jgi:hypothetical protein